MTYATSNSLMSRERLSGLGLVVVAHIVLAGIVIFTVRAPIHRPEPPRELTVSLVSLPKPPIATPALPLVKHVVPVVHLTPPPLLPPPQVEVAKQQVTEPVSQAMSAPAPSPTPPVQVAKDTHVEPSKEPAPQMEDSSPVVDASAAGNPQPVYPRASRSLGEQGCVWLEVFVKVDGTVGDIRIHRSSGFERLDDSALRAVRQWHFKPARQAGKQIAMWYVQPINFDLNKA